LTYLEERSFLLAAELENQNPVVVRDALEADLPEILDIYNDAVLNSTATFELSLQTVQTRMEWFRGHGTDYPLLVAVSEGRLLGYCSLSKFQSNSGYRRTAELSVYVEKTSRRTGIATVLMKSILERAKNQGFHAIISSISMDNLPSVILHERFGFIKVAHLKEVGYKFSKWHDTCYFELIL